WQSYSRLLGSDDKPQLYCTVTTERLFVSSKPTAENASTLPLGKLAYASGQPPRITLPSCPAFVRSILMSDNLTKTYGNSKSKNGKNVRTRAFSLLYLSNAVRHSAGMGPRGQVNFARVSSSSAICVRFLSPEL